jgi:hypothetical protein
MCADTILHTPNTHGRVAITAQGPAGWDLDGFFFFGGGGAAGEGGGGLIKEQWCSNFRLDAHAPHAYMLLWGAGAYPERVTVIPERGGGGGGRAGRRRHGGALGPELIRLTPQ